MMIVPFFLVLLYAAPTKSLPIQSTSDEMAAAVGKAFLSAVEVGLCSDINSDVRLEGDTTVRSISCDSIAVNLKAATDGELTSMDGCFSGDAGETECLSITYENEVAIGCSVASSNYFDACQACSICSASGELGVNIECDFTASSSSSSSSGGCANFLDVISRSLVQKVTSPTLAPADAMVPTTNTTSSIRGIHLATSYIQLLLTLNRWYSSSTCLTYVATPSESFVGSTSVTEDFISCDEISLNIRGKGQSPEVLDSIQACYAKDRSTSCIVVAYETSYDVEHNHVFPTAAACYANATNAYASSNCNSCDLCQIDGVLGVSLNCDNVDSSLTRGCVNAVDWWQGGGSPNQQPWIPDIDTMNPFPTPNPYPDPVPVQEIVVPTKMPTSSPVSSTSGPTVFTMTSQAHLCTGGFGVVTTAIMLVSVLIFL
jgi:hypothetical protein